MRAPQKGLIATGRKISNIEQGISNRRSRANPNFEIQYSVFDIMRFKMRIFQTRPERSLFGTLGKANENAKLLLPPRQSREISQRIGFKSV